MIAAFVFPTNLLELPPCFFRHTRQFFLNSLWMSLNLFLAMLHVYQRETIPNSKEFYLQIVSKRLLVLICYLNIGSVKSSHKALDEFEQLSRTQSTECVEVLPSQFLFLKCQSRGWSLPLHFSVNHLHFSKREIL